jgi:hypothetical protein
VIPPSIPKFAPFVDRTAPAAAGAGLLVASERDQD